MNNEKINPSLIRSSEAGNIYSGITLRDIFAGFALIGMQVRGVADPGYAYQLADEMLEARDAE